MNKKKIQRSLKLTIAIAITIILFHIFTTAPQYKPQSDVREIYHILKSSDTLSAKDIPDIYNCLLPAYPECEKPPFFSKDVTTKLS